MEKLLSKLIIAAIFVVLGGSALLWFRAIERVRRGEAMVPFEPRRPVPWGLIDLLLIFLIVLFTVPLGQQIAASYWNIPPAGADSFTPGHRATLMLTGSLATLASCLAAIALVQFRAGATWQDLGVAARKFWSDVKLGAIAFWMLAPPLYLLQIGLTQIWKYEHPVQDLLKQQTDLTMLAVTLFTAVAVAPLAEEICFRVLLQGWLENASVLVRRAIVVARGAGAFDADELQRDWRAVTLGDRTGEALTDNPKSTVLTPPQAPLHNAGDNLPGAQSDTENPSPAPFRPSHVPLVASAAIFALLHLGHGPAPIPLFFLAIGLGYLYRQTHRATPSIVVHLLFNSTSMAALWIGLVSRQ